MIGDLTLTCTTLIEIFAIHTIRNPYTVASTCVSSSDVFWVPLKLATVCERFGHLAARFEHYGRIYRHHESQ